MPPSMGFGEGLKIGRANSDRVPRQTLHCIRLVRFDDRSDGLLSTVRRWIGSGLDPEFLKTILGGLLVLPALGELHLPPADPGHPPATLFVIPRFRGLHRTLLLKKSRRPRRVFSPPPSCHWGAGYFFTVPDTVPRSLELGMSVAVIPFVRTTYKERETGLEPATSSLGSNSNSVPSPIDKELTSTPSPVCTRVCTSEAENANAGTLEAASLGTLPQAADTIDTDQGNEDEGIDQGDPLTKLAAAIASLSPTDRATARCDAHRAPRQRRGDHPRAMGTSR